MLRVVLFVLVFLMYGVAESKAKLSARYTPHGNPGGIHFEDDVSFVELYKTYEKRRELLKKRKLHTTPLHGPKDTVGEAKQNLSEGGSCVVDDKENSMLNRHGINLARLKGAIFLDNVEFWHKAQAHEHTVQEHKAENNSQIIEQTVEIDQTKIPEDQELTQEKKISTMNIAIKDTSSKRRVCSHDSVTDK